MIHKETRDSGDKNQGKGQILVVDASCFVPFIQGHCRETDMTNCRLGKFQIFEPKGLVLSDMYDLD